MEACVTRYTCPPTLGIPIMRLLPVALLVVASTAALAKQGPEEVAGDFLAARIASKNAGVPSGRELADYSRLLGPELVCTFGATLRYDEKAHDADPDAKPLFNTNDLFSSGGTAPTRFSLGQVKISGGSARIPVHFYADTEDAQDDSGWEDTLDLRVVRTRWRITDVEYGSGPGSHGSLFENLRKTLKEAPDITGWSVRELDACVMDVVPAKGSSKHAHGKKAKGKKASATGRTGTTKKATTAGKAKKSTSTAKAKAKVAPAKKKPTHK